jgi:hypothetical protein
MLMLEVMTLALALTFVVILALSLWRINRQLHLLNTALLKMRSTLGSIQDETAPLNRHLLRLQVAASGSESALGDGEYGLEQACRRLASLEESELLEETVH